MNLVSTNLYIDKFNDIVSKYNNTYHRAIKMKPVDVNSTTFAIENNNKYLISQVGHHVRISRYKNIFAKGYVPNWSEEVL